MHSSRDLSSIYDQLVGRVLSEFSDIMVALIPRVNSLGRVTRVRIVLRDGSFIDVRWHASDAYSVHLERRHVDGTIYRWDNAPHHLEVRTFPHHVHYGSEERGRAICRVSSQGSRLRVEVREENP